MSKSNITYLAHCPLPGYAGETWSPLVGCTHSGMPGCDHCWAEACHNMRHRAYLAGRKLPVQYAQPFSTMQFFPDRLEEPLHWKHPRMVFVTPQSDLFHEQVSDEWIDAVLSIIALCPQHQFFVLTKRPGRAVRYFEHVRQAKCGYIHEERGYLHDVAHSYISVKLRMAGAQRQVKAYHADHVGSEGIGDMTAWPWPLPNLGILASVSTQADADTLIPWLLRVPAAWRGVSYEPALGPVDLFAAGMKIGGKLNVATGERATISLVIAGCESGTDRRPAKMDWFRSVRDQCKAAGVAFYLKQAEVNGKVEELPLLDGIRWCQWATVGGAQ